MKRFKLSNIPLIVGVLALLALLSFGQAWSADGTYYVDVNAAGDAGACTAWASACKTLQGGINKALANAPDTGHTILIGPGTYTHGTYIDLTNANAAGMTLAGCVNTADSIPDTSARDVVIIAGVSSTNGNTIYTTQAGIKLKNLTILGNPVTSTLRANFRSSAVNNHAISNVHFKRAAFNGRLIEIDGGTGHSIHNCEFSNGGEAAPEYPAIYFGGSGTQSVSYNYFHGSYDNAQPLQAQGVSFNSTGTINISNNVSVDNSSSCFYVPGSATAVNIYNNVCFAPYTSTTQYGISVAAGATVTGDNNFVFGNPYQSGRYQLNVDTWGAANITDKDIGITSYAKGGFLVIAVDDSIYQDSKRDYMIDLAAMLKAKGYYGTFYVDVGQQSTLTGQGYYANLRKLLTGETYSGAFEVAAHTWSHSPADATTAGTMTCTGCGTNPKYAINLSAAEVDGCAAHSLCVKTDSGGAETQAYSLGEDNSAAIGLAVGTIKTSSGNKWDITYSGDATPVTYRLKTSSCNDTAGHIGIATAVALNVGTDMDCTGGVCDRFYQDEIYNSGIYLADTIINGAGNITDPQTGATYAARSFANAYSNVNANYSAAVKTSGYASHRSSAATYQALHNFNLYSMKVDTYGVFVGATEAETRAKVQFICSRIAQDGSVFFLLSHNAAELPLTGGNDFSVVLDEISKFQTRYGANSVRVVSQQQLRDIITAAPWTDDADGTVSRTYPATYSNFRLLSGSPLFDAGVAITGLHTGSTIVGGDMAGNTRLYGSGVDIGAYEKSKIIDGLPGKVWDSSPKFYTVP